MAAKAVGSGGDCTPGWNPFTTVSPAPSSTTAASQTLPNEVPPVDASRRSVSPAPLQVPKRRKADLRQWLHPVSNSPCSS